MQSDISVPGLRFSLFLLWLPRVHKLASLLGPLPHLSSFALQPEKQTREYTTCSQARTVFFILNVYTIHRVVKRPCTTFYCLVSNTWLWQVNAQNVFHLKFFEISKPNVPNFVQGMLHFPPPVPAKSQHTCAFASSSTGD